MLRFVLSDKDKSKDKGKLAMQIKTLNAAIVRAMNALRSKAVKANAKAQALLRRAIAALNEARVLLNTGNEPAAYWHAQSAQDFIRAAKIVLQ